MLSPFLKNTLLFLWLISASFLNAQVGPAVHVAGSGSTTAGGPDNIPATTAAMRPMQLSFDAAGHLHLADANGRISRVDKITGLITTVAGGGTGPFGGPATGVALNGPCGVRVDSAGHVVISESCFSASGGGSTSTFGRISKVTNGVITTVAGVDGISGNSGDGGPAILARLGIPLDVTTDAAGNIFFPDAAHHVVRRIDAATGIISRVAGAGFPGYAGDGGNASDWGVMLNNPTSVAVDAAGNIFIADFLNSRIRKITAATGLITTVVGTGTAGFNGDGRLGLATQVNRPHSLALDSAGHLYFADSQSYRVRKLDAATGVVSTVFNYNYTGVTTPASLAISPDQKIYYTEGYQVYSRQLPTGATTLLTLSLSPAANVEPYSTITLTAQITPATATGSVSFLRDGLPLTTVPLVNGIATFTTTAPASSFAAGVAYAGAPGFLPSVSAPIDVPVKYLPALTVTSSLNPSAPGQSVTFTANLSMGSGNVEFFDGALSLGATYVAGSGSLTVTSLAAGVHNITARFPGDSYLFAVTSPVLVQTVAAPTSVALTANPSSPNAGQAVTLTATVTPATATGTVEFLDGASVIGSGTLASGVATFSTSTLTAGAHSLTARYNGNTSPAVAVTVKATSTVAVVSSANPATLASPVTFTANVTPATATGSVQFFDGATSLGTATLAAGSATLTVSTLTAGSHSITAQYAGNASVAASTSAVLTQTVKATSSVALAANPLNAATAQTVTLTATATPAAATGAVEFLDGAVVIGTGTLNAGVATFSTTTLTVGAHSLTARYNGDTAHETSTSTAATVTIKTAATVALTANPNPAISTNPTTLTATVTPATATGTMQFLDGGVVVGTGTLAGGVATLTLPTLSANPHTLTAEYSGDSQTAAATGTLTLNVLRASTVEIVATTPTPSLGQSVTFTAFVGPNGTTGTVEFFENGVSLGSSPIAGGAAQVTTSSLGLGARSITATYSGNSTFAGSTAPAYTVTVKTNSTYALTSSANPATVGQSITLTATLSSGATGTVSFLNGSAVVGTAPLTGGVATLTTSSLAAGTHLLMVTYGGDTSYYAGQSAALAQVVKANSTLALASNLNPANPGQNITFTATVSPATATGNVVFLVDGAAAATVAVNSGVATFGTSTLGSGSHTVTAQYAGDNLTNGSNGGPLTQVVRTATTAAVASNANPSVAGQTVTITATVSPAATGSVQLLDNGAAIGTAALNAGVATFTTSALGVGTHSLTVSYAGSGTHLPSTSAALVQTVNKASSTAVVASSLNPSTAGQAVTFTVSVTPATATGTVQLKNGTATLATLTLTGGVATYTTSSLAAGSRSITAVYAGDTQINASTSAVLTQVVRTATTLTLTSNRNPATKTQNVTFTARVNLSAATGSVQFFDGATLLGTGTISSGRATLTRTFPVVGTHPIQAVYSGSATHAPSTSAVLNQTINN